MFVLLSANVILELFGPLLVGAGLAMFMFMLGHLVATRNPTHALDADDCVPESPGAERSGASPPGITRFAGDARIAAESVTSQPCDVDGPGITSLPASAHDVPAPLDRVPTRDFVRPRGSTLRSVDDFDQKTVPDHRIYLESSDLVEC